MLLVICAIACAAIVASSSPAFASGEGRFCPYTVGTIFLHGYGQPGDRCAGSFLYSLDRVQAGNEYSYWTCADAKPNSDGSGGDLVAPDCRPSTTVDTGYFGPVQGYAVVINKQGAGHNGFYGYNYWSG